LPVPNVRLSPVSPSPKKGLVMDALVPTATHSAAGQASNEPEPLLDTITDPIVN